MPRDRLTEGERRRRHRLAYPLSLELGITPAEAEAELARRDVVARHRDSTRSLAAKMSPPIPRALVDPEPPPPPYWQRD
jgi:hypothetical protein